MPAMTLTADADIDDFRKVRSERLRPLAALRREFMLEFWDPGRTLPHRERSENS